MNEKELIEKEAEKMRVTLKARLLPNLPLDENEPLLKPRTHVTKIINTMEFDWHLNEMFKAGKDSVTEIVTNLFEREDYKLGFKAGQDTRDLKCGSCKVGGNIDGFVNLCIMCSDRLDEEIIQKAQQDTARKMIEDVDKEIEKNREELEILCLKYCWKKELIEDDRCIKSLKLLKSNWGDKK